MPPMATIAPVLLAYLLLALVFLASRLLGTHFRAELPYPELPALTRWVTPLLGWTTGAVWTTWVARLAWLVAWMGPAAALAHHVRSKATDQHELNGWMLSWLLALLFGLLAVGLGLVLPFLTCCPVIID